MLNSVGLGERCPASCTRSSVPGREQQEENDAATLAGGRQVGQCREFPTQTQGGVTGPERAECEGTGAFYRSLWRP